MTDDHAPADPGPTDTESGPEPKSFSWEAPTSGADAPEHPPVPDAPVAAEPEPADAEPTEQDAAPGEAPPDATDAGQDAVPENAPDETPSAEDDSPSERRRSRTPALVALAAAIALVFTGAGLGVGALLWSSSGSSGSAATPLVRNLSYGVVDTFNRDDAARLGVTDSGQRWYAVRGAWGITQGSASVTRAASGYNLAVTNSHTGDGTIDVTLRKVATGAGLVFRYHSAFNYWMLVASPKFATWTLQLVSNGKVSTVGDVGVVPLRDETTIGVQLSGPTITVVVDGQIRKTFTNPTLDRETWVGLVGYGRPARLARWTALVAAGAAPATPTAAAPRAAPSKATAPAP